MKYCLNRACDHRLRVRQPAEFTDDVLVCSDCGTLLVNPEAREVAQSAYRRPAKDADAKRAASAEASEAVAERARLDRSTGALFLFGGIALTVITYVGAHANGGGGTYFVATGPMIYGLWRLVRGASAGSVEQ